MPKYNDAAWWRLQRQLFAQDMSEIVMEILLMGGADGATVMPPGYDVLIDWDVFNRDAVRWLRNYLAVDPLPPRADGQFYSINQMQETTRRQTVDIIEDWILAGEDLRTLEKRLQPVFGKERAGRIAATEVTRIYAEGNVMAWKSSGVVNGLRWRTANDDRVCPICGPLHMTIVDIDRGWTFTQEMLDDNPELARALRAPQTILRPPAHVNCRCGLTPVVFEAWEPEEIEQQRFGVRVHA